MTDELRAQTPCLVIVYGGGVMTRRARAEAQQ